jgi:threonine/homoserine/homoserine lactone efflux protein
MTLTLSDVLLYLGALVGLVLTPGPVWVALIARTLQGGFGAAWPLAVGVCLGDLLWPLAAILGLGWLVTLWPGVVEALHWVAAATLIVMGALILRGAARGEGPGLAADPRLTRPGRLAGFAVGVAVVIANPKAILFYAGLLPGFFDVARLTWPDVGVILAASVAVPLAGNLLIAGLVGRARALLASPQGLRRTTMAAGALLILVGLAVPFL